MTARGTGQGPAGSAIASADLLRLAQLALDRFEDDPLAATMRRVVRIANLLGETHTAVRLGLELKATGGHPPANAAATKRLMADPSSWGIPHGVAEQALNEYMAERTNDAGLIVSHSLDEIEFWQQERATLVIEDLQYASDLEIRVKMTQIVTRARHHAFTLLCAWERQLTFATTQASALDAVSAHVDALLARDAPDVTNKFNAAFRRLRDQADRTDDPLASEELSQALTSCRRILKAVVDLIEPADPMRPESEDGQHSLSDEQYKNRLVEFLKRKTESSTFRAALVAGGESLFERFDAVDALASKGVHARVAVEEAEFCALHTYLLAGEIIALNDEDRAAE